MATKRNNERASVEVNFDPSSADAEQTISLQMADGQMEDADVVVHAIRQYEGVSQARTFIDTYLRTMNFLTATESAGVGEEEKLTEALARYMVMPEVVQGLENRLPYTTYNDQALLAQLNNMVMHTLDDFLTIDAQGQFAIDLAKARRLGAMGSVKKLTVDRYGKVVLDLYDRFDAITLILRIRGYNTGTTGGGVKAPGGGGEGDNVSFTIDDVIRARKSAAQYEATIDTDAEGDETDDESM